MSVSLFRQWFGNRDASGTASAPNRPGATEAEGQFQRGLGFATGAGQDYAQAAQWYTLAAEQDHCLAQFNLAVMFGQGQGMARDAAKWLMWMTRAAELGDAGAQYQLGVQRHVTNRKGGEQTPPEGRIEALKWVRLSAAQGYRGAERACEFVTMEMTPAEVEEGGRRVAAFVAGKRV